MKILRRHIGSSIIRATLFVVFVLLCMQLFILFVNQLDDIGEGNYGVWQAFQYVFLMLPGGVYHFFPMAGLMGSLMGLGSLASHRELVVMRAAGVSVRGIVWSVLRAAILLIIIATLVGEFVAPFAMNLGEMHKAVARSGGQTLNTERGIWMRDRETFVHIQTMVPGVHLLGVTRYRFDEDHRLEKVSYARRAVFRHHKWQLRDISETYFMARATKARHIDREEWDIEINPELLNLSRVEPDELSLIKLSKLIDYRRQNDLEVSNYVLGFWQRLVQPFSSLVMILLAVPFVMGSLRAMTMGVRMLIGVIFGLMFYLLNRFFGSFSVVYAMPPVVGVLLPSLVFLVMGWIAMRRVR